MSDRCDCDEPAVSRGGAYTRGGVTYCPHCHRRWPPADRPANAWSKLPPAALEAHLRDARSKLKPGDTAEMHEVDCPLQVGEACNCEPIIIEAESS